MCTCGPEKEMLFTSLKVGLENPDGAVVMSRNISV